ncbi:MAG: oxidoreductase [Syntrophomonadaceae bacterium]|nr:oxidoreductase [Syntrophomonadaceae bacterium]
MAKPKLAFFKFTSCAGCLLSVLNLEDHLLDIVGAVDIVHFLMARRETQPGPYDVAFIEGAVSTPHEVEQLKEIRRQSKVLVALGNCAVTGGVPSMKNFAGSEREMEERVYSETWDIKSIPVRGLDYYVKVDEYLRGCSIDLNELVVLLKSLLLGVSPRFRPHSVCNECKLKENVCLLISKGKACMGSVSAAGCGALCPSLNRPCEGCRGPSNDANAEALAYTFVSDLGLSPEEVRRKFQKYAGNTPAFRKGAEAL